MTITFPSLIAALLAVALATGQADGRDQNAPEEQFASVNSEPVAENLLTVARQLAALGDYATAAERYQTLVGRYAGTVIRTEDHLFLPIWRQAVSDLLAWPAEGHDVYRQFVAAESAEAYRQAAASGDPAALERVVTLYFLSDIGDSAAAALADRLVESGEFALAVYYYRLVLDFCPDSRLDLRQLRVKAVRAARLGGLDSYAAELSRKIEGDPPAPLGTAAPAPARTTPDALAGGADHVAAGPVELPAIVSWTKSLGPQKSSSLYTLASTPVAVPVCRDGRIFVAYSTTVWCLEAADGRVIWRMDSAGMTEEQGPPSFSYEQAHRPLVTDEAVIVPVCRGDSAALKARTGGTVDLLALDPGTGRLLWQWSAGSKPSDGEEELTVDAAPVVDEGRILVPLATLVGFFGESQTAALDRATGVFQWRQALGAHDNELGTQQFQGPTMPMSTALAGRGGILLSAGGGLISAQSAVSGLILWTRQEPQAKYVSTEGFAAVGLPGAKFNSQVDGRMDQVLVRGSLVIGGDILATTLGGYDLLTGKAAWSRAGAAGRSSQLLALAGDRFLSWGRTVTASDTASGEVRWEAKLEPSELIVGTPLVAGDAVLVPTTLRLAMVNLADGRIGESMYWPEGRTGGNLAAAPNGLLVAEPRELVCYESWIHAEKRLTAEAQARPAEAAPLLALADAAFRTGRVPQGLDLLARAAGRGPSDMATATAIYRLCERLAIRFSPGLGMESTTRLFALLRASAVTPETAARAGLIEAAYRAAKLPDTALALLHHVLASAEERKAEINDARLGVGPAGLLAERQIAALISTPRGAALLQRYELAAEAARQAALRSADPASALVETARKYPETRAARTALGAAVETLEKAGRPAEAARLLRRIIAGGLDRQCWPADSPWSAELRLARDLAAAGLADQARGAAAEVLRAVPPEGMATLDGKLVSVKATVAPILSVAPQIEPPPMDLPAGPFHVAWTFDTPGKPTTVAVVETTDWRSAKARAAQPLVVPIAVGDQVGIWGLDRRTGEKVWSLDLDFPSQERPNVAILQLDDLLVVDVGPRVAAIDPATGALRWRASLQRPGASDRTLLLEAMDCGAELDSKGSRMLAASVTMCDGLVRVETSRSVHLLDPADGLIVAAEAQAAAKPAKRGEAFDYRPLPGGDLLMTEAQLVARETKGGQLVWQHKFAQGEQVVEVQLVHGRALVVGQVRKAGVTNAFVETLNLETGASGERTQLVEQPRRFTLIADEAGLLVMGPGEARWYAAGSK
jgi:outer membrane protein assembly factor BamB